MKIQYYKNDQHYWKHDHWEKARPIKINGIKYRSVESLIHTLVSWYWRDGGTVWINGMSIETEERLLNVGAFEVIQGTLVKAAPRSYLVPLIDTLNNHLHGEDFWNSFSTDGNGIKSFEGRTPK